MVSSQDIAALPYALRNGIKYFTLVAEPVQREILPGLFIKGWGYNGSIPGPTIQVFSGDFVNICVMNRLPGTTTVHWHGLDVPNDMDGVPEVEPSPEIPPGTYFDYRFKVTNPPGTHMYHSHFDSATQLPMGLCGGFIILPSGPNADYVHRDYFMMLQEFTVKGLQMNNVSPGIYGLDPESHDFNFFTINGRCFPFVTPMQAKLGEIVRIRLASIGHDAHPMHLHGQQFMVSAADGNTIPYSNRLVKSTVTVASGETYDIEFKAVNPGPWPFHCHIPHHASNNMQSPLGGMTTAIDVV